MPDVYDLAGKRVWVAGHRGMVGGALVRRLEQEGCSVLIAPRGTVDFCRQSETEAWIAEAKPQLVYVAAAKVGGILANATRPAEFLYDNLAIEANIIHGSFKAGVEKLVFLGSSCIYPKLAPQPIQESSLLTGPLEPTNEWYAIAKIAGIKLCQAYRQQYGVDYISAMPTNLYGPGDNFDLSSSHVMPALIRKVHDAKTKGDDTVTLWGTGSPRREFLHVEDCADALVHLTKVYSGAEHVNVGSGEDLTIRELMSLVIDVIGYKGTVVNDTSKPDGTPRKLMSADRLRELGWAPKTELRDGIAAVYTWFLDHKEAIDRGERVEDRIGAR